MITRDNIKDVLLSPPFSFADNRGVFSRHYGTADEGFTLEYNSISGDFIYPEGVTADRNTTKDEHQNESFVVFLCVAQLFERGYLPQHLKLEGRNYAGNDKGYCDILVSDNDGNPYLIIECKTASVDKKDDEFRRHWAKTMRGGDQLFRYFNTYRKAQYLCLYAADFPAYRKDGETVNRFENIYHIISLVDNDDYLQTDSRLHSFREMREQQGGSDDFFSVWKQTYKQDYNTRGLLEPGIEAFNIGKKSYSVADLQTVDEYSLDKKYNEFALILRKHTISSHENAFDKLVNLFLAKIIDERYYPKELRLLWKGAAYDDYFSLQDRLISLYKQGMKEFFDDEVASVENWEIDNAFCFLTAKADEARDTIKRYFRKLKYFNNNPFAFLDVHNEQLFYKNAVILKDTITMLQDIYLTKNTDNQFLGDLFEGFLNRGVHQSEGQFFTPTPIVRFLVSSLPLRQLVEDGEVPCAIDYACGAGHFLTEYARQIRPFVAAKADVLGDDGKPDDNRLAAELHKYYSHIVGIEKDYRLSKVSQVAAFMYGMDGIHIHYGDGLEQMPGIKDHTFSVLVANPPYSVSGFLETLPEEERTRYTLADHVSNIEKNNSIETFFIERAAQLLKSGGVAAIVLPSSILSKGGLYMHTRELLLQCFDIVSICCLGPNTFGQTNTSTVVLFLRRKALEPDLAKHSQNRIAEWFKGNMADNGAYHDTEKLAAYIRHMGYNHDDYIQMLKGELTDGFLSTDMAKDYVKALNIKKQGKNSSATALAAEAKKVRDAAQRYVKSRDYKGLTPAGKEEAVRRYTLMFIREIEKEKLYYWLLAASNPQPVLVVQSPADKEQEKKFLGYEWSNRKGDEGIHYLNTGKIKKSSSDDEDADDDTIEQIKGIDGIQTPMFNPLDPMDENRINAMVRKNYCGEDVDVWEEYASVCRLCHLTDMLDFTRVTFEKELKAAASVHVEVETKWPLVKLKDICRTIVAGGDKPNTFSKEKTQTMSVPVYSNGIADNGLQGYTDKAVITEPCVTISARGTLGFCVYHKSPFVPIVRLIVAIPNKSIDIQYLYYALTNVNFVNEGASTPQLSVPKVAEYTIPLPPMDIQKKIAEECAEIDKKLKISFDTIQSNKGKISITINAMAGKKRKLSSICELNAHTLNPAQNGNKEYVYIDIDSVENGTGHYSQSKLVKGSEAPSRARRYATSESTIISTVRPNLRGFAYIEKEIPNSVYSTGFAVLKSKDIEVLPNKMIYYQFMYSDFMMRQMVAAMPKGSYPSINKDNIENFDILVSVEKQDVILKELDKCEKEIHEAMEYIKSASALKQSVLDKYLK